MGKKKPRPIAELPSPSDLGDVGLFDTHTHLYATVRRIAAAVARPEPKPADIAGFESLLVATDTDGNADADADVPVGQESWYRPGVDLLMERALAAGVSGVCTIGDGIDETRAAVAAAQWHDRVWAACAIHPTMAHTLTPEVRAELTELAHNERCVAVGETGLDAYWIGKEPEGGDRTPSLDVQEEALRWHIDLAVETGKALMIHNREADERLFAVLDDAPRPVEVVLHCFSSPLEVAKEAFDRGYVLSFAGNSTFKPNQYLRDTAALAPEGQFIIETDAPFMTPEPYRGYRNETAFVGYTAQALAEVRGVPVADFVAQSTANARRVFGLGG